MLSAFPYLVLTISKRLSVLMILLISSRVLIASILLTVGTNRLAILLAVALIILLARFAINLNFVGSDFVLVVAGARVAVSH